MNSTISWKPPSRDAGAAEFFLWSKLSYRILDCLPQKQNVLAFLPLWSFIHPQFVFKLILLFVALIKLHCRHTVTTQWLITPVPKEDGTLLILANVQWNSSLWRDAQWLDPDHGWVPWSIELTAKSLSRVVFDAEEYPGKKKQLRKHGVNMEGWLQARSSGKAQR